MSIALGHRIPARLQQGEHALPGRHRLLADITPLRESAAFRRLWAGTTLSSAGSALASFAVVLQVYDLTRSPVAVGMLGVAQMVPTLAVGLLGSPVTDVMDRRKLVLATSGCLAAASAVLAAQALVGLGMAWVLYALTAAQSALSAVDRPARGTFVPSLLSANQLAAGLALNRLSFQIGVDCWPRARRPHRGRTAPGPASVLPPGHGQLHCRTVQESARLPAMPPQSGATRPGLRAAAEGIGFIRRGSPVITGAFLADLTATVFGLPVALFPAINAERFGGDPRTLGLFTMAIGLGGLASAAFSGLVTHVSRQGPRQNPFWQFTGAGNGTRGRSCAGQGLVKENPYRTGSLGGSIQGYVRSSDRIDGLVIRSTFAH